VTGAQWVHVIDYVVGAIALCFIVWAWSDR